MAYLMRLLKTLHGLLTESLPSSSHSQNMVFPFQSHLRKFYSQGNIHICTCVEKLVTMLWTLQDGTPRHYKSIQLGSILGTVEK